MKKYQSFSIEVFKPALLLLSTFALFSCSVGQGDNRSSNIAGNDHKINTTPAVQYTGNFSGNIVASAINPVINPANGNNPVLVTLLNDGNANATSLNIAASTPIGLQNSTCSSTLNSNQSCSFQINATSLVSGQSSVMISYTNSKGTQLLPINVTYISQTPGPLLKLTPAGSFNNVTVNKGSVFLTVNVQNIGNTDFTNLQFNDLNAANPAIGSFVSGSTCSNGQSLAVNSSCNMVLSYNPTSVGSGTATFIVSAGYSNQNNQTQTYSNSSLILTYSSVSGAIFKAIGDFGMVITSPAGAAGTWSANVDSPFATTTIGANSMLINNGTYVMSLSTGAIKYSSLNGLFWQTSPMGTGALNASTCSVIFDGTYYYTCGTVSTAFGTICTTTGRGCVIRSNNLAGSWSPLFTPAAAVAINNVYYFNNGTPGYVATIANATANTGLATSTTGAATWLATSSGQATAGNNSFTPVVLNDTGTLTTWNSNGGYSSSVPITSIGTAWSPNASQRPGANSVIATDALYRNSVYTVALSDGDIYTTANPQQTSSNPYTRRFDGTVRLNKMVYASGIGSGTYFAVGNTGVNVSATTPTGTWTSQTPLVSGQSTNPNLTGAFSDGANIWVTGVSTILKSANVTSWITPGLQSITKNGSAYLAVDNQGNIYSSADSVSWVQQTNPTSNVLNAIYCAGQNLCFAVGNNATILKSVDGLTWTQLPVSGTTNNLQEITCYNGQCIVVGGGGISGSGTVLLSNDNSTWTLTTNTLATTGLNSIVYYNDSYIAVGNTGTIFSSTNGINWQLITSGVTQNLNSIDCGNNIGCVAVGNAGTIIFSSFGPSWATATSGTSNDLLSVVYNGVFASVGKGGVIRYSATGTGTWTSSTFPTTSSATNNLNAIISN
jgi:hypothetical protein